MLQGPYLWRNPVTFLRFMSTAPGRAIRVVMGVALIAIGLSMDSGAGWALAAFGLLPLVTGAANICPISPFVGQPLRGGCGRDGVRCT